MNLAVKSEDHNSQVQDPKATCTSNCLASHHGCHAVMKTQCIQRQSCTDHLLVARVNAAEWRRRISVVLHVPWQKRSQRSAADQSTAQPSTVQYSTAHHSGVDIDNRVCTLMLAKEVPKEKERGGGVIIGKCFTPCPSVAPSASHDLHRCFRKFYLNSCPELSLYEMEQSFLQCTE